MEYFNLSKEECMRHLQTQEGGLSQSQVSARAGSLNEIVSQKKVPWLVKFLAQFKDLMILILLVAAALSITIGLCKGQIGEVVDGAIILAIVFMNAIFGLVQENKAEKSLDALKKMTEPEAYVRREGQTKKISVKKIVPGDVVILQSGTILPADLRLIQSVDLQIDESSLTGESLPAKKNCDALLSPSCPLADRANMCYRGTVVVCGRGEGVVTAIGGDTEIGKIAQSIKTGEKESTPLQKNIKEVGKFLTYLVLAVAFVTFLLEVVARPGNPLEAFLTAVAISVAAIPESMPAVITIIMSLGISRLAKQKAIVKHMHSVETLGCCDVICSDKTGTITQNRMTVANAYCDGRSKKVLQKTDFCDKMMLACMTLCNDVVCGERSVGDATEIALCNFSQKCGINKADYEKAYPRLSELPFDSKRKLMSTLNNFEGQSTVFTKGAFDCLIAKCGHIIIGGERQPLRSSNIAAIEKANRDMADKGMRVLAFAYKQSEDLSEDGLTFLGLVGMYDPPRKEIKAAVKKCKKAGMRAVMITGDHKDTAFAIARECGIASDESQVLTGVQLDLLTDQQLDEKIENVCVFARVSPENKVRIVEALKKRGHIVAMTGDGVNDAPSLKRANIGIGMGRQGTDVTKEVADMLVSDDNFATIVVAVEEGRKIYQNIVKAVKFLFSANIGELMSLFLATIIFPNFVYLYPVQILFVNLITDSLPAIALGVEPPESDLMIEPPRDAKRGLFSQGCGLSIVVLGFVQTVLTIIAFYVGLRAGGQSIGVTMAFYTLNIIQMFYLASMRTNGSIFKSKPHKNKMFLLALAFCFGLLGLFALTPIHTLLKLESLSGGLWLTIFALSFVMMIASELFKICYKFSQKHKKSH